MKSNIKKTTNYVIWFAPYILVLLILIVFLPTFFNKFQTGWDDTWQVLENPFVIDASFENIQYHFTDFYHGQYSPINTLVYIAVYELFGFNAIAFHTTFLLFHIFNVLLVFYILKDIIKKVKTKFSKKRIHLYALFIALIFAIHPMQVESVAWVSASKVIMYSFYLLLTLYSYIRYIRNKKFIWLAIIALLYALSFGSKEQAIILPLNLLLFDYVYGRFKYLKLNISILKERVLLEKLPFLVMTLGFWYFSSLYNLGNIIVDNSFPLHQRIAMGAYSFMEYIFRSIAPVKLYFFHSFPIVKGETLPLFYWGYLILVFITGSFVWSQYKRKNTLVIFGFLFFLINLLLVLHILPFPRSYITADRFMYLSIIGMALIMVWFLDNLLIKYKAYKKQIAMALLLYILFLGVHTFNRTKVWKDTVTMKKNVNELIEKRKALRKTDSLLIKKNDE
ncbi:hypothetical protein [Polaribacter cellanae]|uniref:Glycosyltransferase RgtA/B/C/D-like domain-containing protein n=1 Tax=Polaribacter cellanae TaxID=2818493 RepID=A0A975CLN6_9FLAO|nr:hypothetical protein [Polaribacter cellanae]QTE22221.1 hypothetical protein J3359_15650 [Polaribacter cellanae]